MVEFNENGAMKAKNYTVDCVVGGKEHRLIIVITNNECIFFANDGARKHGLEKETHFYNQQDKASGS